MDKKTVAAFGLIFVVIVGWSKMTSSLYGDKTLSTAADSTVVQITETAPATVEETPAADVVREEVVEPTRVSTAMTPEAFLEFVDPDQSPGPAIIETNLYRLEIDPRGGRLVRWSGKEHRGPEGLVDVELVPEESGGGIGNVVEFQRGEINLDDAVFFVEGSKNLNLNDEASPRDLVFRAETRGGVIVRKIFTFHPGQYVIDVTLNIEGNQETAQWVGEAQRARFTWEPGIRSTERMQKFENRNFRSFASVGDELVFKKRDDLKKSEEKATQLFQGSVRYAGVQNKYFHIVGVIPGVETGQITEGRIGIGGDPERFSQSWWIELPMRRDAEAVGYGVTTGIKMYVGPSEENHLKGLNVGLDRTMELGFKIFRPLAVVLMSSMHWMQQWISNYGLVIIIISFLTRIIFYPLTQSSTKSMRKMSELQPKLKAIQEKYKDNKEKVSQETMKLYKEEKVNPLGGCLPLLVQSPIFIALYQVLSNDIALRQQPFVWWINDLAQPDAMFHLPLTLPHFGGEFNLLPFLMAGTMYFQSKLTPTSPGAGGQMAMMNNLMPIMMLVFFYNMPSGLVMYWTINTVVQLYQSWRIKATTPAIEGA